MKYDKWLIDPNGNRLLVFGWVVWILMSVQGCSVYMAAHQPDKKDIDLFKVGIPRAVLLDEFGQPSASDEKDGERTDVFSFVQGYSKGAKNARATWHGVADVMTIGLWEVVGTPTESLNSGDKMVVEVKYDKDDRVAQVKYLRREKS